MIKFFDKKDKEPKNFEEVLKYFKKLEKNFQDISIEVDKIKKENKFSIQKIGVVRFNPFNRWNN